MNDYKFITHRTIGKQYKTIIQAESMEEAEEIYDNLSGEGELDLSDKNCIYTEITEEFLYRIWRIKMTGSPLTKDLSRFGNRELAMAADILKALAENTLDVDISGIKLYFNLNSGCVFLSNDNCDVWMMNGEKLESWYSCPICGHEGFLEDMEHGEENTECEQYCQDIEVYL